MYLSHVTMETEKVNSVSLDRKYQNSDHSGKQGLLVKGSEDSIAGWVRSRGLLCNAVALGNTFLRFSESTSYPPPTHTHRRLWVDVWIPLIVVYTSYLCIKTLLSPPSACTILAYHLHLRKAFQCRAENRLGWCWCGRTREWYFLKPEKSLLAWSSRERWQELETLSCGKGSRKQRRGIPARRGFFEGAPKPDLSTGSGFTVQLCTTVGPRKRRVVISFECSCCYYVFVVFNYLWSWIFQHLKF